MDYFEYLNKNIEQQNKLGQQSDVQQSGETASSDNSDILIFGDETPVAQNADGSSVFSIATSEQLNNIDYEKIVSKDNNENDTSINYVLKDVLSFSEVRKEADTDGDGEISADEARKYFTNLASKDGDGTSLTTEDINILLKEKGVDLEKVLAEKFPGTETSADSTDTQPENTAPAAQSQESATNSNGSEVNQPAVSSTPKSSAPAGTFGNMSAKGSYRSGSGAAVPVEKTINNMSLEELQVEKTKREATLTQKQNAVNAVHNGTNEKVNAAKTKAELAKNAMSEAVKNDENVKRSDKKDLEETLSDIASNDKELSENEIQINNHELEISNKEDVIKSLDEQTKALTEASSTIESSLSKLNGELASLGKSKDEKVQKKKDSLNKKIKTKKVELSAKKKEISEKQKDLKSERNSLEKLKKEKTDLEEKRTKLEKEKAKLNERKAEIEEKIKKDCSPATKAKIKAYEEAQKNVEIVKNSELKTAQEAQNKALNAVKEVNAKIAEVQSRKMKSVSSDSDLNVGNIPASVRAQLGGKVTKLPDGTEVLTFNYTKVDGMKPEMVAKIKEFQRIADEMGITFVISDGTRSVAESNAARARKGSFVAKGGSSPHNYGTAIDIALYKDGRAVSGNQYNEFAQRVKTEAGVEWGGDWGSYGKKYETQHFQLANWKRYKTEDNLIRRHMA